MTDIYRQAIEAFADGRAPCNCGEAYYTNCGTGMKGGVKYDHLPACKHGCSANKYEAKHELVEKMFLLLCELLSVQGDHMTACQKTMGESHPCTCGADKARKYFSRRVLLRD